MRYSNITAGTFLERPNRFIAYVDTKEGRQKVHVKNTGRCGELLRKGARVYLTKSSNPDRKTAFDLVAVEKGGRMVNIDSAAPNAAVREWLEKGGFSEDVRLVKPESAYGGSRFDFYVETSSEKIWMEVKGVTLERENAALFPDAPSERALKHVEELIQARLAGYEACIVFVVQIAGTDYFTPNVETQPKLAEALVKAEAAGVRILAVECEVTPEQMIITGRIPVRLAGQNSWEALEQLARPLLAWYDENRRILPWREEPSPYRVWISEIMLQQTRVEAVKPYFERFMELFPDVAALAEAQDEVLLKAWEGLGYYSRARNLKKAACKVMEEYGGRIPDTLQGLLSLPGIGSYTAGAVASIAFGLAQPAVDGNVLRILARYRMDEADILDAKVKKRIEGELLGAMPADRPGDFNQAMMELGATVCLPGGKPKCGICPWREGCLSHRNRCETDFPKKTPKKERKVEEKTILVIQDAGRTALRKRPDRGLLAGMYEFPSMEGKNSRDEVLRYLKELGFVALHIRKLPDAHHVFTHKEWRMTGFAVKVDELAPAGGTDSGFLFAQKREIQEKYPIPSAYAAYMRYLDIALPK